jgi:hypothetical protein
VREYRGERFEVALLHYYKIMNYLNLQQVEPAAVECRRLDHRLDVFSDQSSGTYRDDPFLRYLTGTVYAVNGDGNDADVSLRKALEGYRQAGDGIEFPGRLLCDLAANVEQLGGAEEARRYREEGDCRASGVGRSGTVRLFLECGEVSFKIENDIVLPIFANEIKDDLDRTAYARTLAGRCGRPVPSDVKVEYLLRISLPDLVETPSNIAYARVTAAAGPGQACAVTVTGANLSQFARQAFEEEQPTLLLRAAARGLAKYLAKRQAEEEGGELAGVAVNLFGMATETADTRSWCTLPEKIAFAALDLAAGTYDLQVELYDRSGRVEGSFEILDVAVAAGKTTFLNHRVY